MLTLWLLVLENSGWIWGNLPIVVLVTSYSIYLFIFYPGHRMYAEWMTCVHCCVRHSHAHSFVYRMVWLYVCFFVCVWMYYWVCCVHACICMDGSMHTFYGGLVGPTMPWGDGLMLSWGRLTASALSLLGECSAQPQVAEHNYYGVYWIVSISSCCLINMVIKKQVFYVIRNIQYLSI